ncbi:DeoR/GlpR family DNA-binding transcription regulator [Oscillospiraceae bacterium PP1C4]
MNKKTERINRLIEILKVRRFVSVKELASLLGVSQMTIRRDLAILESNRVAENIDGTTVYNPAHTVSKTDNEYNLLTEVERQYTQKDAIGRFAATLIEPNDIIILDTGTTTEKIVPHIPNNLGITALCYNINILMELRRNTGIRMLFSGGNYHSNTQMFECPEGIAFIEGIRAQKVFISAAGIHETLGVTCVNSYEVPTKRAVLASSLQHILVADSQKFDAVRPAYFCPLSAIDVIVTDSHLSQEWRTRIQELGITLHLV